MSGLAFITTVVTPPMSTALSAMWEISESGVAAHQTIAARPAATSWIHEPAAVTQSRALSSGKVHASFTLQKNAGSKYSSIAPISWTWPPKYLQV